MKKRKKGKPFTEIDIKIRESGRIIDNVRFTDRNLLDDYLSKFSLIGGEDVRNKSKKKK